MTQEFSIGSRFGRYTIISDRIVEPPKGRKAVVYYDCVCDCGTLKRVKKRFLVHGESKSCGCLHRERFGDRCRKHGEWSSPLYKVRAAMIQRCENPNFRQYNDYGGRGITICQEWRESYEAFRDWSYANGYSKELQIDRINNDAGYSPDNCRWTTPTENMGNRRNTILLTAFGETKTAIEWSNDSRCTVGYKGLCARLKKGKSVEEAITSPFKFQGRHAHAKRGNGESI